jgi:hypothetical protein
MIKVYVQELATYNNAVGVGKWVDVENFENEVESLYEEATEVLKEHGYHNGNDAEEYEIFDWDCEVDINLNYVYQDIEALKELNELLINVSKEDIKKISFLMDSGYGINQIDSDSLENVYIYEDWNTAIDEFIEYYLEIPTDGVIINYIDYEKIQNDLEMDGYMEHDDKIYKNVN